LQTESFFLNELVLRSQKPRISYRGIASKLAPPPIPKVRHLDPSQNNMRVFLDDERATPEGWVRAFWPSEVIELLETGLVTEVSLDHDLGNDERGTGYDVILWVEEAVVLRGFKPPRIRVHSANSSARERMLAGISAIEKHASRDKS
jgi:hypothetical protein